MAESVPSCLRERKKKVLTESDMVAAQQLMQLSSDDDNSTNINNNKNADEEIDQNPSKITSAKIKEIFGEKEEVLRPRKRRYKSLVHIYMMTKPMNVRYGKKRKY